MRNNEFIFTFASPTVFKVTSKRNWDHLVAHPKTPQPNALSLFYPLQSNYNEQFPNQTFNPVTEFHAADAINWFTIIFHVTSVILVLFRWWGQRLTSLCVLQGRLGSIMNLFNNAAEILWYTRHDWFLTNQSNIRTYWLIGLQMQPRWRKIHFG